MSKRLFFVVLCGIALVPAFVSGQTAAELEGLLDTDAVTYAEAAGFILRAADAEVSGAADAFAYAAERGWLPAGSSPLDRASLSGVSLLIMESFGLEGGLFYAITKNPHYAYRELEYRSVIMGRADPGMEVSGDLLIFMLGRVLSATETENTI